MGTCSEELGVLVVFYSCDSFKTGFALSEATIPLGFLNHHGKNQSVRQQHGTSLVLLQKAHFHLDDWVYLALIRLHPSREYLSTSQAPSISRNEQAAPVELLPAPMELLLALLLPGCAVSGKPQFGHL